MAAASARAELGRFCEAFATQYLLRTLGWTIERQNWRCRSGELDIIAWDADCLVVVEVRCRSGTSKGSAAESVVGEKLRRLRRLTPVLLRDLKLQAEQPARIDVIAMAATGGVVSAFTHYRGVEE